MTDFEEHFLPGMHLFISFAGDHQKTFQFGRTFQALGLPHVLMRDSTQRYHGSGVLGIGDRTAVLSYLRGLRVLYDRVTMVGISSGAYAALLYGQLVPVDHVIAISPLTGREVDDFAPEWHSQIIDPAQPEMDDLRKYFQKGPRPKVQAFISDHSPTCTLDRQMCTRINIPEECITVIPGYEHGALARGMRDLGMFRELFK